jgi:DNA-binding SARP family transcriptional activator
MAPLELRLLGGFEAHAPHAAALAAAPKKARALLAYLASPAGKLQPREKLADLIWGDVSRDEQARRSLRQSLTALRRCLPDALLEARRETVALRADVEVDVARFERLAAVNLAAVNLAAADERDALEAALDEYRGEFLEGFSARADAFDAWVDRERSRLREIALGATARLSELQQRAGDLSGATTTTMRLVALDPLRESGHRQLMRLYEQTGRTSEAVRQFHALRELLRDELGTQPDAETLSLAERLRVGGTRTEQAQTRRAAPVANAPSGPELRHVAVLCVIGQAPAAKGELRGRTLPTVERFGGTLVRASEELLTFVFGLEQASGSEPERAVRAALELATLQGLWPCGGVVSGQLLCDSAAPAALRGDLLRQAAELAHAACIAAVPTPIPEAPQPVERSGRARRRPAASEPAGRRAASASAGAARRAHAQGTGLPAAASGGRVIVSAAVAHALGARAAFAPIAHSTTTGAPAQRVLRLLGPAETFGDTPLVGRAYELSQLVAALELCVRTRRGRTFIVRGEPGIGKTRLVSHMRAQALALGFAVHARGIVDFGGTSPDQEPMAALIRELLDAPDCTATQAVERLVAAGAIPSGDSALLLDALHALPSGVREPDPGSREEHLRRRRDAVARLFAAQSERIPRMVWVDDLHWGEPAMLAQLQSLIPVAQRMPLLLVLTTRIDGEPQGRDFQAAVRGSAVTTLDLAPLSPEDATELARELAPRTDDTQLERAIGRAQGNPLFLEQLLHAGALGAVPPSVQALVQARMDALDHDDRAALCAAAILGHRVALPALAHVLGADEPVLEPLVTASLLRRSDDGYAFVHVLVRDGVYQSLTNARRTELHRLAAAFYAGRDPALYAQHLDRASDPRAAGAYLAAAEAQRRIGNLERADAACARGLSLAEAPQERMGLCLLQGEVLCDLGRLQDALRAFQAAERVAPDTPGRARATVGIAAALRVLDRSQDALAALASAERLIDPLRDAALLSTVHYLRGSVLFPLGDSAASLHSQQLALQAAHNAGSALAEARALSGIADAHFVAGRLGSAREWFERCERSAIKAGALDLELSSQSMLALIEMQSANLRRPMHTCLELAERARAAGALRCEVLIEANVAWASVMLGQFRDALEHGTRTAELAARIGAQRFEALGLAYAGIARANLEPGSVRAGDFDRALELAHASGLAFAGATVYAAMISAERNPERLAALLAQADGILDSTLHIMRPLFVHRALMAALGLGEHARAQRYADSLRAACASEPTALGALHADFARLLAAWSRGERGRKLSAELDLLRERLVSAELRPALECFDRTLRGAALPQ